MLNDKRKEGRKGKKKKLVQHMERMMETEIHLFRKVKMKRNVLPPQHRQEAARCEHHHRSVYLRHNLE